MARKPTVRKSPDHFQSIRLSPQQKAQITELARRSHRSVSAEIRLAIERHLEREAS